ncbi:MAG: amidohydrolase [Bacteroidales bacterium]|nr:amidohydrolase [Bacteroidales bacterium]MCF8352199.1 amidohydrolase [Bacteroidales bacterium]MCF8375011.1 amidohydrolase [Bacteroidales bacterium]MCF8402189.1 amidohydrolase [Bacteroidales bacterium]
MNALELIRLRHKLHRYPELSGEEENTAALIRDYIRKYEPDQIVEHIAGNGLAFVFEGKKEGPVVLFRCELDALPIQDVNDLEYKSVKEGVGHKCGHDGHMVMVAGLAHYLSKNRPECGKVILLYQPEEETGQGAEKVVKDEKYKKLKVDYVFALHNLPGYNKGEVVLRKGVFASASKGMIMKLQGKSSHAGEPENGINPAMAIARIIQRFNDLYRNKEIFKDFSLITIIHCRIGERAFGTNPGYGELMATLRSYRNDDMEVLTEKAQEIAQEIAIEEKVKLGVSWLEEFPASVNDDKCVDLIRDLCEEMEFDHSCKEQPFKWSEDFAHFLLKHKGALFGLGSGTESPQLHNPDYDFPDEIIEKGTEMFHNIYKKLLDL